jgi:hypothetical protein
MLLGANSGVNFGVLLLQKVHYKYELLA